MSAARGGAAANDSLRARLRSRLAATRPSAPGEGTLAGLPREISDRYRHLLPATLTPAAVLVPILDHADGLTVLLTERAPDLRHHPGQISFPGGRIEADDAGPLEAALRETEEEIGLSREFVSLAGYLDDHVVISGFRVTPVVAFVRAGFDLRLDRTEVESVFEVPLEFVLDPKHHLPQDRHFQGLTLVTYDIPYQGRQIWGATANMLISLHRRLRET